MGEGLVLAAGCLVKKVESNVTTASFKCQCLDYFCVNDTIGVFGFLLLVLVINGRVEVPALQIP